jgi:5-methyltetrahydrofolate--homocysteine methyltransferase
MQRIEKGDMNTQLAADEIVIDEEKVKPKEKVVIPHFSTIEMPQRSQKQLVPPFWGRKVMHEKNFNKELAFEWINHRVLFRQRWGYKRADLSTQKFLQQEEELVKPLYEKLKGEFLDKNLLNPIVLYGYFPCVAVDNKLYIFDQKHLYNNQEEANMVPSTDEAIKVFEFPRQTRVPHRCIADFFSSEKLDVIAFSCVSAGLSISDYERTLYDEGKFQEYYHVHGLGVELAEALAEIVHKQIRLDLDIVKKEGHTLKDVQMKQYTGCRYSPGYAACPDLEMSRLIFDLLTPEEFGVELSETFQIHPEQSTCAIIVPHKEASYYNV